MTQSFEQLRALSLARARAAAAASGSSTTAAASPSQYVQPTPPPGEIIHGADRSYISDRPEISAVRNPSANERDSGLAMQALASRGRADGGFADTVSRKLQPFTQGQSLGFGDELISTIFGGAKAATGGSFQDAYDYAQEFQHQELDRQRAEAPLTSLGMEAAGGLTTGGALAGKGVTIAGRMASNGIRNLAPRMAAGAAEGAGYGAVAGFGGSDGSFADRSDAAAHNAMLSAIFGAGAVPAVDLALGMGGRAIGNAVSGLRNPGERADDLLIQAITRDSTTPGEMAIAVGEAGRAGQPEFAAVDAGGRNVQRLAAMAAKSPGEFRETAATAAAARQQGQGDRIGRFVNDALGDGSGAHATEQDLIAARRAAAQPAYEKAYQASPPAGSFYDDMMTRQSVSEALTGAERTAAERQIPITDLFAEIPNPNATTRTVSTGVLGPDGSPLSRDEVVDAIMRVPTTRGWDFVKRELDAKVNQLYASGDTTRAEAVKETRNALRGQLSADNPDYAAALQQYADRSGSIDAIQTGRDLVNARNPDEAAQAFRILDLGQKALGRVGASRELGVKMDAMRTPQDKTQLFDSPAMRSKMDMFVEDPTVSAVFGRQLDRERAMVRSNRQMQGGSSTFENFADGGDVSNSVLGKLAKGQFGSATLEAAGRMLGVLGRAAQGMNSDVANRVGNYLLSADPTQIARLSDAFDAASRSHSGYGQFVARLIATTAAPEKSGD